MSKVLRNQTRAIIEEFAEEVNAAKIPLDNKSVINFRDDVSKNTKRLEFKILTSLLRFRKDNGRIASDVITYESSKGELNEATDYGQGLLRLFLERKDPEKTETLRKAIKRDGQLEVAVVTADGFLINGNRRKMVLESLQQEYPGDEKYKYLRVVILPGKKDSEPNPTLKEIEQIENRYQLQVLGKAEYYNFDKALSIKRKIELGMSLKEQLQDDPNFFDLSDAKFERKMQKFMDEYMEPLNAIDRYLLFFNRPGHYNTISEGRADSRGRWQAFRDYHNSTYKKMQLSEARRQIGLKKNEIKIVEDVAFKIIRLRNLGDLRKKVHIVMRDLLKLVENKRAKRILFTLKGEKGFVLKEWESVDEEGNQLDERTKDVIWSKKFGDTISSRLIEAYEVFERKKRIDSPVKSLEQILKKITEPSFSTSSINRSNFVRIRQLITKIKKRLNEIDKELKK
jgi:hypothetical protein